MCASCVVRFNLKYPAARSKGVALVLLAVSFSLSEKMILSGGNVITFSRKRLVFCVQITPSSSSSVFFDSPTSPAKMRSRSVLSKSGKRSTTSSFSREEEYGRPETNTDDDTNARKRRKRSVFFRDFPLLLRRPLISGSSRF